MPSIKKKLMIYNYDETNDDERNEMSNVEFLKDIFTLDDFLECEKTKNLLDQDWEWKKLNLEEELYNFYTKEVN